MRYTPYESEYAAVPAMGDGELLDYFLLRVVETEELWGLSSGDGWLTITANGRDVMPVWPYERFASEAAAALWPRCQPVSVALEFFIHDMLDSLVAQDLMLDVLHRRDGTPGYLVSPHRLLDILTGIMDAGEYRLEG